MSLVTGGMDGVAEVADVPEAIEGLVEYFRCISSGGFPPELFEDE